MRKIVALLCVVTFLASCKESTTKTYKISNLTISAEGPLFDGPNTMQANHVIDLNQMEQGLLPEHITEVKLTKAEINTSDSMAFNNIRNFVLQLASSDAQMQKIGVLNPVPANSSLVQILPAADADLLENFKLKDMIVILDADLIGDRDDNLSYTGNFEFQITYKK